MKTFFFTILVLLFALFSLLGCSTVNCSINENTLSNEEYSTGATIITGWGPHMGVAGTASSNYDAETLVEQLANAAESKDYEVIKTLFSQSATQKTTALDNQIEELCDIWEGVYISCDEQGMRASESWEYGEHIRDEYVAFEVKTSQHTYYLALMYRTHNTIDQADVGIYAIHLIKAENANPDFVYWGDQNWIPGIIVDDNA